MSTNNHDEPLKNNGHGYHGGNDERSAKDELLALARARGATIRAAAKAAGVSERTAHRRCKDPEFVRLVRELRTAEFERSVSVLPRATTKALKTLVKKLDSENENVQVRAARTILIAVRPLRDAVEQAERIEGIETWINEHKAFMEEFYGSQKPD